jgi:hypothetical protein
VPAADVGDEHDLFDADAAFVVERRRDRLVLKADFVEADLPCGAFQRGLRLHVADRVVVDEEHRPAEPSLQ